MILDYPGLRNYEELYGRGPVKPYTNVYEALAVLTAAYKATADRKYLDLMLRAVQGFSLEIDGELAKNPTQPPGPGLSAYWRWDYAFIYLALCELEGTPEFDQMMEIVGAGVSKRANAWPIAPFMGAYNMAFDAAFWYDLAVSYGPKTPRSDELKAYANKVWDEWWKFRDMDEDDSWYSYGDMIVLDAGKGHWLQELADATGPLHPVCEQPVHGGPRRDPLGLACHVRRKIETSPKLRALLGSDPKKPENIVEIYLTIVSRMPTEEELQVAETHVKETWADGGPRDLFWALINSLEFCFRH